MRDADDAGCGVIVPLSSRMMMEKETHAHGQEEYQAENCGNSLWF
jgi:hypothetical protein